MILRFAAALGNIGAQRDAAGATSIGVYGVQAWLAGIDWFLAVAGILAGTLMMLRWWVRRRPDPLDMARPRPNRVRGDAILLAVAVYLLAISIMALIAGADGTGEDAEQDPRAIAIQMILGGQAQLIAGIACVMIGGSRFRGGARAFLAGVPSAGRRYGSRWSDIVLALVLALGLCPLVAELTVLFIHALAPDYAFPVHPTLEALHGREVSISVAVLLWFGGAFIAPAAEEVFFRGLVQTWFVNAVGSRWVAVLLASCVFGLVHSGQPYAIPALITLAVILGVLYELTGSLVGPIVIHALFNLKTLIWDLLGAFPS